MIDTPSPTIYTHTPTRTPTNAPTLTSTFVPSDQPSDIPSQIPSLQPSPAELSTSPTVTQTSSSNAPTILTSMPTTDKVSILAELFLIDNPYTSLKDLYNPSTAQGRSLLWITKEDKITLSHVTKAMQNEGALVNNLSIQVRNQIRQRFILVALDLALHRPPSSSSSSSLLANLTTTTAENKVLQPEIDTDVWNDDGVSLLQEDAILTPALSFPNQHECKWTGIICSDDAVEQIIWARRNLSGRLVPELALLESLTHVDLAQNNIEDNLDVFWRLPRLKTLYLFDNAFQGSIAEDIAKMSLLENLYLGTCIDSLDGWFLNYLFLSYHTLIFTSVFSCILQDTID